MQNIVFLDFEEIMYCLIISFFITIIIKFILFLKKIDIETVYPLKNGTEILDSIYKIFPKELITFKGRMYKKGTKIKVLLNNSKVYEGELIGANSSGTICLMTQEFIITIKVKSIIEINTIRN